MNHFTGLQGRTVVKYLALMTLAMSLIFGCAPSIQQIKNAEVISHAKADLAKRDDKRKDQFDQALAQTTQTPPKTADYQVGPEDLLEIQVFGQDNLNRAVRINGQGEVSLPLIGALKVAGMRSREIERRVMQLYDEKYLHDPQVNVFVKEYRHQRITITGAVEKPGYYEMIGSRSLMEMLGMAGGVSDRAGDTLHIIRSPANVAAASDNPKGIRQPSQGSETIVVDLRRFLDESDTRLNLPIQHGDIIRVPHAANAYVYGAVRDPGPVPVKEKLTVSQAVAFRKGLSDTAARRVSLLRFDEKGQRVTIDVDLNAVTKGTEPDVPIKGNDIVVVSDSTTRFLLMRFFDMCTGVFRMSYSAAAL